MLRKFRRYGEECGKTGKTGLLGRVYELNSRGDIMPVSSEDGSYTWSFGKWSFSNQDSTLRRATKAK